jgi:hypothetical protein
MSDTNNVQDLAYPDALIRLTSTVLKFRVPSMSEKSKHVDFLRSFHTVGTHPTTQTVLKSANSSRDYLFKALSSSKTPHKTVLNAAQRYILPLHQILVACRVQPESARLDERLIFEWSTGIEEKHRYFKSEAIMYELVMTIATEGLAHAGIGADECLDGDFAASNRSFKKAAGVFDFLFKEQLPQWHAKGGNTQDDALPAEAKIGVCEAYRILFMGISQQMAMAKVLMKDGTPTWSLCAKLSLGIAEQFEEHVSLMRSKAASTKSRIDSNQFLLMAFQIEVQRALSFYFHARHYWESALEYGLAIGMLSKAIRMLQTRVTPSGRGLPEISSKSPLKVIESDLNEVKAHMNNLLESWEKDNSRVYFEKVITNIPSDKELAQGVKLGSPEPYILETADPVALILPDDDDHIDSNDSNRSSGGGGQEQHCEESDYELAKRLQEQLNAE